MAVGTRERFAEPRPSNPGSSRKRKRRRICPWYDLRPGLDSLRRAGWKGHGPIPWDHRANRGFLRCLAALARAAGEIDEKDETERCWQFLKDSSAEEYTELKR